MVQLFVAFLVYYSKFLRRLYQVRNHHQKMASFLCICSWTEKEVNFFLLFFTSFRVLPKVSINFGSNLMEKYLPKIFFFNIFFFHYPKHDLFLCSRRNYRSNVVCTPQNDKCEQIFQNWKQKKQKIKEKEVHSSNLPGQKRTELGTTDSCSKALMKISTVNEPKNVVVGS